MLQIIFMSGRFRRYSPARSNGQKDDVDTICNATFQELFYTWFLFLADMGCAEGVGESAHLDTIELCDRVYWWCIMDDERSFILKASCFAKS